MSLLAVTANAVGSISRAESRNELSQALKDAVVGLGFQTYSLAYQRPHALEAVAAPHLTTWPCEQDGASDQASARIRDPLLDYAVTGVKPLIWRSGSWKSLNRKVRFPCLRGSEARAGLIVPLPDQRGRIGAITMLSAQREDYPEEIAEAGRIVALAVLVRAGSLAPAVGAVSPALASLAQLSPRQIEILDWIAHGKSNSEIALILGLSRRNVTYHVSEILKKLDVTSRTQAVGIYTGR
ncbi:LuxR family transcriptional regulator [Cereibacter sphaeroides]|uniref:LuxR family transcriptional regulator n=1 Tax=Cereibacter sphaeroides TaxID=1063 RepID=UPI00313EE94F